MDVAFLMGMIFGFILAFLFFKWFTGMVTKEVINVLSKPKRRKRGEAEYDDDPVNWWKPKGWKPGD